MIGATVDTGTDPVARLIERLAARPQTGPGAVGLVALTTMLLSLLPPPTLLLRDVEVDGRRVDVRCADGRVTHVGGTLGEHLPRQRMHVAHELLVGAQPLGVGDAVGHRLCVIGARILVLERRDHREDRHTALEGLAAARRARALG